MLSESHKRLSQDNSCKIQEKGIEEMPYLQDAIKGTIWQNSTTLIVTCKIQGREGENSINLLKTTSSIISSRTQQIVTCKIQRAKGLQTRYFKWTWISLAYQLKIAAFSAHSLIPLEPE